MSTFPIILSKGQGTKFKTAVVALDSIIDQEHQSVVAVVSLLVIESFGEPHDSEIASEILAPLREKHKNA